MPSASLDGNTFGGLRAGFITAQVAVTDERDGRSIRVVTHAGHDIAI